MKGNTILATISFGHAKATMMTSKAINHSVLLIMADCLGVVFAQSGAPTEDPLGGLMLAKLASSQTIIAGLVSKDFDQIRRGANDMMRICDATQWETNTDEVYAHHRRELRRQADRLATLAAEGNLEGAAFLYTSTVSTCITCHQHCRDVLRIALRPTPNSGVIPIPTTERVPQWSSEGSIIR